MVMKLISIAAFSLLAGAVSAQTAIGTGDAKVTSKNYNLRKALSAKGMQRKATDMDGVVRLILQQTSLKKLTGAENEPRIIEIDRFNLEIRATAKAHAEITGLLQTLEGVADLAIDIRVELIEIDPAEFEKTVKPLLVQTTGRTDSPLFNLRTATDVDAATTSQHAADRILKAGKLLQKSTERYTNGIATTFSKRHLLSTYKLHEAEKQQVSETHVMKEGYQLVGIAECSTDRRVVRLKLTEQAAELVHMKERKIEGLGAAGVLGMQQLGPEIAEYGSTGSLDVDDGGAVMFRLAYTTSSKIWVVILRPIIFIQAEENARKGLAP